MATTINRSMNRSRGEFLFARIEPAAGFEAIVQKDKG